MIETIATVTTFRKVVTVAIFFCNRYDLEADVHGGK